MEEVLAGIEKVILDFSASKCTVLLKNRVNGSTMKVPIQNVKDNIEVYSKDHFVASFMIILPPEIKRIVIESEPKEVSLEESE